MMPRMGRVLARDQVATAVAAAKARGESVAFANGCFDVLHVGHVRYLQAAAREADVLVVAINSDASVRDLKGRGRPVQPEHERAEILAAIEGVSFVTVFAEPTVEELLRTLRPDVHCKGTDYTPGTVPERDVVREIGARIAIVGDAKEHDSSAIIEAIARNRDQLPT